LTQVKVGFVPTGGHRRIAMSLLAGTFNSATAFSIVAERSSHRPERRHDA
jgi:hypothetical protein